MARINKSTLTKLEIIRVASRMFLEKGYSGTTIKSVSDELDMSTGNLTFYFPTKEYLLAPLVEMLIDFQRKVLNEESGHGVNPILAACLELVSMAVTAEESETARDLYLSAYTSPLTLDIIRRCDGERAKSIYNSYCPDWTDEQYEDAEMLVSGIEHAVLISRNDKIEFRRRVRSALDCILNIYNVPKELRDELIEAAVTSERSETGSQILAEFKLFVEEAGDRALEKILKGI